MSSLLLQVTLDLQNNNEKFGSFLRAALDVLSQLLEIATLPDIGKVNGEFEVYSCGTIIRSHLHRWLGSELHKSLQRH